MTISVAIQMDPVDNIDFESDSSYLIALEAQRRGYVLYHYEPRALYFLNGQVTAKANVLDINHNSSKAMKLGKVVYINLDEIDVILVRQDPPFDMAYITTTYLLEKVKNNTLVLNNPSSIRDSPEKLLVTLFEDITPPTLITSNLEQVILFRNTYKDIIIKPLYGNGGSGVFHLTPDDENLSSLVELFNTFFKEPMIIQKYLPEVRNGDKRIILVDGKPVGAINRVPAKGEARSNMHIGGKAEKSNLNSNDELICKTIEPELIKRGLHLVGIDVIGRFLTEINVTSPTGLQEINKFNNTQLENVIWDSIEQKFAKGE